MTDPAMPSFAEFSAALHGGRVPFPWQQRLADLLAAGEPWPSEIGVPTGLGKTSCLDIAVWWLAGQADRVPTERTAPTRIWWLVNRRLLVDTTTDHAERLAAELEAALTGPEPHGPLGVVARRLVSLTADRRGVPLEVHRLRGGAATGRPSNPAQPAVILSTLPMYGSRVLFRGYGSSRSMRPIDAALAGTDSLVLIDEAHLVRHLAAMFDPLGECDRREVDVVPAVRARPQVVSLTATGTLHTDRFDLNDDDRADPIVAQRIDTPKPVRIVVHDQQDAPDDGLVAAAVDAIARQSAPCSAVVFVNTPRTARAVADRLEHALSVDADVVVLTGRTRERESAAARERILDPATGAPAGRPSTPRKRHLVVVATQTLEVGADVDFEVLVTQACGVRALTQRLGRLNRFGSHPNPDGIYVHQPPKPLKRGSESTWPVYGTEPVLVLERLLDVAVDNSVDLCPSRVADVLGEPGDDPGRAPEHLPALVWEWVKTSNPPPGEAPVEPYFSGLDRPDARVSVCWRAFIPDVDEELWPRVRDEETVDVPIGELRDALEARPDVQAFVLNADRVFVQPLDADTTARPGDVVIVPCDAGLLDQHGWAPASTAAVVDVSLLQAGMPLNATAIGRLVTAVEGLAGSLAAIVQPDDDTDPGDAVQAFLSALREQVPRALSSDEWQELLDRVDTVAQFPARSVPRLAVVDAHVEGHADELDELSLATTAVDLDAHSIAVGQQARAVADALGLPDDLSQLASQAGRFHDIGKADQRFQRWLDPARRADHPVAKSDRTRANWRRDRDLAGWPAGGRHEELSRRLVAAWLQTADHDLSPTEQDLLSHLVVSHHGHARPLITPVADPTTGTVDYESDGTTNTVSANLSTVDWEQPARFLQLNDVYGYWGLALLEAIVRQADHFVSAGLWRGSKEVL